MLICIGQFRMVETVEFLCEIDQRMVAASDHVGNHAAHHLLDVHGRLALAAEKGFESDSEIRGAVIQADRQRDTHGAPAMRGILRGMTRSERRSQPRAVTSSG